jgi:hypothetical protein
MKDLWKAHASGSAVLAALAVAGWFVLVRPMTAARHAYGELAASMVADRDELERARQQEGAIRQAAEKAIASLAARPLMLEPATAVNTRLQAITDLAAATGVRVDTIEAGRPDDFGKYAIILIQLTARGPYVRVQAFLQALHEKMPDVEVASMELSGRSSDGPGGGAGLGMMLKMRWHTAGSAGGETGDGATGGHP